MADTFSANMAGLRGPGLTGADKALFDAKLAAGDLQLAAAKKAASVASDMAGIDKTYVTKADANTALPGLTNGAIVQVLQDESQNSARTAYKVSAGAFALIGKIAYVLDDLSNVSQTVPVSFKAQLLNGGVSRALYNGGWDEMHKVNGYVAAIADYAGRHRFTGKWGGNNVMVIRNTSNEDGYSAWCVEDFAGRERGAGGFGNPKTGYDGPFAGKFFFEASDFIPEGGGVDIGPGTPMIHVMTTNIYRRHDKTVGHAQYGRTLHGIDGSWTFHAVHPDWSKAEQRVIFRLHAGAGFYGMTSYDMDNFTPILRARSKNGYDASGVVIGDTYEPANGPPPQAALDVGGNGVLLSGDAKDAGRAELLGVGGASPAPFGHVIYHSRANLARWIRQNVAKLDWRIQVAGGGLPVRLELFAADGNATPIWMALDGSGKAGVAGNFAVNGKTPAAPAALPAALPTDGTATNAAMATMLNAIRASLIAIGLNVAA